MDGVTLYDIDDFGVELPEETKQLLAQARQLLEAKAAEFESWYDARDVVPMLLTISGQASEDVIARIDKKLRKSVPEQQDAVEDMVGTAVQKVVNKLMFAVRDSVDVSTFRECVDAMRELYEEETER